MLKFKRKEIEMMKKIMIISACLLFALMVTNGFCAESEGIYTSGNLGVTNWNDASLGNSATIDSDTGIVIDGALGYRWGQFRGEGELSYQKNDLYNYIEDGYVERIKGDTTRNSLMFNGYYDFANSTPFTPFLGAGLGLSHIKVDARSYGECTDTVFTYSASAGVALKINDAMSLEVKYSYLATSDLDLDGSSLEYNNHNVMFGVRYNF